MSSQIEQLRSRADALRAQIRHDDYLYYVLDRPEVSDAAYDRLFARLRALETEHPSLLTADSPTQRVAGSPSPAFPEVLHRREMLSLEATTERDVVARFLARVHAALGPSIEFVVEPKFDGLSLEVVWEHGVLSRASTRGDGTRGEGVTANVRTIRSVPLRLRAHGDLPPRLLAVRGEALIPIAAFRELNRELERASRATFANPRNAAAGSIRQLDPKITASRPLEVTFYDVLAADAAPRWRTSSDMIASLRAWGVRTSSLRRRVANLAGIERLGKISAAKLAQNIARARRRDLARFLFALGIPGVGARTGQSLSASFGSLEALRSADAGTLQQTAGVGPELARSVTEFFKVPAHRRTLDACLERGLAFASTRPLRARITGPLAGKTVVFTGGLRSISRASARALLEQHGGRASDHVGAGTDFVVAGSAPGSKLERARTLGVQVLDESGFLKLLDGRGGGRTRRRERRSAGRNAPRGAPKSIGIRDRRCGANVIDNPMNARVPRAQRGNKP